MGKLVEESYLLRQSWLRLISCSSQIFDKNLPESLWKISSLDWTSQKRSWWVCHGRPGSVCPDYKGVPLLRGLEKHFKCPSCSTGPSRQTCHEWEVLGLALGRTQIVLLVRVGAQETAAELDWESEITFQSLEDISFVERPLCLVLLSTWGRNGVFFSESLRAYFRLAEVTKLQ